MNILPIAQDNKGRFNRRLITLTGEKAGYNNEVFVGVTDTKKEVFIKVITGTCVGIRYTSDDAKKGYKYCSSLGWANQYEITNEEKNKLI